jgi:hypothetical protein
MITYLPIIIPLGLALFIVRAQLLRVAIRQLGIENLHDSKFVGAVSGWLSLGGAMVLVMMAFSVKGFIWGVLLVVIGLVVGIAASALVLPFIGQTLALGHHGGEGDKSVAAFNRRYGAYIALAVAVIAAVCLYSLFTVRI